MVTTRQSTEWKHPQFAKPKKFKAWPPAGPHTHSSSDKRRNNYTCPIQWNVTQAEARNLIWKTVKVAAKTNLTACQHFHPYCLTHDLHACQTEVSVGTPPWYRPDLPLYTYFLFGPMKNKLMVTYVLNTEHMKSMCMIFQRHNSFFFLWT